MEATAYVASQRARDCSPNTERAYAGCIALYLSMGRVRMLPTPASGVRLADAVRIYLATITVPNTRATYAREYDPNRP
ncbi:hypothetical protein OG874_21440 [Nocardia sp. NBC_00565]|uniref:hypothetical protein n=1 Tax=Nocardia sp. NBC_00565 TaxID=2975993 RepID=UPI002E7FBFF2|nr:hypothetical protein [Nocardia sp. NBC_00565]WUC07491.1 hypothetical protein OG874_21440 [Nocardia sp. NBC_00565]